MRIVGRSALFLLFLLASGGCDDLATEAPTVPGDGPAPAASRSASAAVASASGGANWVLEVFGLEVPQVLGFQARKSGGGEVRGRIQYHQVFQGERFRFNATVTCLEIYDGNRAKFGGEVVVSNDPAVPPGTFVWFQVIDHGEGSSAPADESTGAGFGSEAENEAFCASPAPPNPIFLAEVDGDIRVDGA